MSGWSTMVSRRPVLLKVAQTSPSTASPYFASSPPPWRTASTAKPAPSGATSTRGDDLAFNRPILAPCEPSRTFGEPGPSAEGKDVRRGQDARRDQGRAGPNPNGRRGPVVGGSPERGSWPRAGPQMSSTSP